jgi:hypothetical protein
MPPVKVAVLGGSGLATPALVEAIVQHPGRRTPTELVLAGRDMEVSCDGSDPCSIREPHGLHA